MTDTADRDALILVVQGVELPITPPFTNRELHLIKQIAGVRAGEFAEALAHGDSDLLVALAHVGLRRAGRTRPTIEELWDLDATAIDVIAPDDLEPDAGPDPQTAGDGHAAGQNGVPAMIPASPGSPSTATS